MRPMTLGQFATAVGASPRWVQNARAALGLRAGYDPEGARRLAFARLLNRTSGMPLREVYRLAKTALAAWPAARIWTRDGPEGACALTVDLERFLSDFAVRLSLARSFYAERRRGRPRRRHGVALAKWYGLDLNLLEASLWC